MAKPLLLYAGILFCMVFAAVGMFAFIPSLLPLLWKSVPCEVLDFELHDDASAELPFSADVRYRFKWMGKPHESNQVGIAGWKDARTPSGLVRKFSESPKTICYLPGGLIQNVVLLRPSPKWGGLFFIGFGVGVGWIIFHANRTRNLPQHEATKRVLPAVTLLFVFPGLLLTLKLSLPVWAESIEVLGWNKTPAKILWSELRSQRNSKSTSYRADICYEYHAAGRTWRNNRVHAGKLSGPGRSAAVELERSYPSGLLTYCYVHPAQPEKAILLKWPGWAILLTLFPLPFLLIAIWVGRETLRETRASRRESR